MSFPTRLIACAGLTAALGGCATFGTNVEGDFSCRAPKGGCAPSDVIDAGATAGLTHDASTPGLARVRAGVATGDIGRTSERTLRIVFPAHVDDAGTLHDEAVAWAVVENPRWAAELRRKPGEETAPPLMRQLSRQLEAAQVGSDPAAYEVSDEADASGPTSPSSPATPLFPHSSVASPLVLPSTAREAVAGAKAPAVEGFDMSPLHDRTPRPGGDAPLTFPSIAAIEAAKAQKDADTGKPSTPAPSGKEPR